MASSAASIVPLIRFLPSSPNNHHRWSFKSHSRISILHHFTSYLPIPHRLLLRSYLPPLMASKAPDQADSHTPHSNPTTTVRVVIKGRVQGVFYRDWTVENASELGLNGWVRNRRDGSVEALFSGRPESVAEMERRCRLGPPAAIVTGFQVFPSSDEPPPGFDRLRTA